MTVPARAVGAANDRLAAHEGAVVARGALDLVLPTDGLAFVRDATGDRSAIWEGNRAAILPDVRATALGREWLLSVKGVGARAAGVAATTGSDQPAITDELWTGDAPFGGQGDAGAAAAIECSHAETNGVHLCPVVAIVEVPERVVARDRFTYRRYRGRFLQEHRLVPSDVRLYHGTEAAFGRDPERALLGLGVDGVEDLDAFIERFLASGIAALTLWARTARQGEHAIEGLDYDDVWLDKDAVLAPDGTLFIVDLESLVWTPVTTQMTTEERILRQVDRNYDELVYALDAMLDVRDRWLEREADVLARRRSLAARLELALAGDRFVRLVDVGDSIDIEVRAPGGEPVRARILDRR